jgi:hypothetical protein
MGREEGTRAEGGAGVPSRGCGRTLGARLGVSGGKAAGATAAGGALAAMGGGGVLGGVTVATRNGGVLGGGGRALGAREGAGGGGGVLGKRGPRESCGATCIGCESSLAKRGNDDSFGLSKRGRPASRGRA